MLCDLNLPYALKVWVHFCWMPCLSIAATNVNMTLDPTTSTTGVAHFLKKTHFYKFTFMAPGSITSPNVMHQLGTIKPSRDTFLGGYQGNGNTTKPQSPNRLLNLYLLFRPLSNYLPVFKFDQCFATQSSRAIWDNDLRGFDYNNCCQLVCFKALQWHAP